MNFYILYAVIAGVVAGFIVEVVSKAIGLKVRIGYALVACALTSAMVLKGIMKWYFKKLVLKFIILKPYRY